MKNAGITSIYIYIQCNKFIFSLYKLQINKHSILFSISGQDSDRTLMEYGRHVYNRMPLPSARWIVNENRIVN